MLASKPIPGALAMLAFCLVLEHQTSAKADIGAAIELLEISPTVSLIVKGASLASSIVNIFGDSKGKERQEILEGIEFLKAQNKEILANLDKIMRSLDALPGVVRDIVRQELRAQSRREKINEISGMLKIFYELRRTEILSPESIRQDSWRRHEVKFSDMKALSRELMLPDFGFTCFELVGRTMVVEFWLSKRIGEPAELRREAADAYFSYFERALSDAVSDSVQNSLLKVIKAQQKVMQQLNSADAQLATTNTWFMERGVTRSEKGCTRTVADLQGRIDGSQNTKYAFKSEYVNYREMWICARPPDKDPGPRGGHSTWSEDVEQNSPFSLIWTAPMMLQQDVEHDAISAVVAEQGNSVHPDLNVSNLDWIETDLSPSAISPRKRAEILNRLLEAKIRLKEWEQFLTAARSELQLFRDVAIIEKERAEALIKASILAAKRVEKEAAARQIQVTPALNGD